jgi:HPt (histidine-containing phosphotransfer) domain-containing protein
MQSPGNSDAAARADLDFWRDLSEGDDDAGRELVTLYLGDTSAHILLMISGLANGRAREVAIAAHTCAGSSATCGVDDLARLFRQLEDEARDNRHESLSHTLPIVVETFDRVRVRLLKAIAASTPEPVQEAK